ncbi:LCP family protein [Nocardioides dongxiaopingii]|uniref:LCP family protein n=1 Tax=Nocardioides dongxiaopingii TaxID=2576036 RepID=UPI001484D9C9|nr:LCP family protein [Nocardioides dongxiaopingii]
MRDDDIFRFDDGSRSDDVGDPGDLGDLGDDTGGGAEPGRRRWTRRRRFLVGGLSLVLVLVLAGVGGYFYLEQRLAGQIDKIPGVFAGLEDRPTRVTDGDTEEALNILLIGTDRRSEVATTGDDAEAASWVAGQQRSDTIIVLHIDADREAASVISIPRDSWVDVPGHGSDKINAAFSLAGPSLAVETVEKLTNVRIDHLAVVDWDGFAAITDALGGVTVTVPETVHDSARDITWTAGDQHLDGEQALNYARQRYGLPGGDFDRVKRQQAFLRALAATSLRELDGSNPKSVYDLLDVLTRHLSVDDGWSTSDLRELAVSLRSLRGRHIDYLTAPVEGTGMEGAASVVYLDQQLGRGLWDAVRTDDVGAWVDDHPGEMTPQVVR